MVALGEDKVIEGWLLYGAALNAGRKLYPDDDRAFGRWVISGNLPEVEQKDREAAMWADNCPPQFLAMRRAHPKVRTVRGLHAKWKETQPSAQQRFDLSWSSSPQSDLRLAFSHHLPEV